MKMSPDAKDRHVEPLGKRYASVLFSSFFFFKMNQFLRFFFFISSIKDCIFFSLKTQKKYQYLLFHMREKGRIKKNKKREEGNKRGDAYFKT